MHDALANGVLRLERIVNVNQQLFNARDTPLVS